MTQNERLVVGLVSGLLVLGMLAWFWQPITYVIHYLFLFLFPSALLITYIWWLYAKRAASVWLAPRILLGCLLLTAGMDMRVYQRAQEVSYRREETWISELVYWTPTYDGEGQVLALVMISPLLGAVLLWRWSASNQRGWQFLRYFVLLLTFYPGTAPILLSSIGTKPRYYEGARLPGTVPDSLRDVRRDSPHIIHIIEH